MLGVSDIFLDEAPNYIVSGTDGGAGDDFLRGSFGNDTIHSGEGNDYLWGGWGDDRFVFTNNFGNDQVDAGNQDEVNGDTLDLSAVTDDLRVDLTNGVSGHGSFTDGTSTATYIDIENIILSTGTDTLVLADESGSDTVSSFTGPTDNGDGTFTGNDMLDVTSLTSDSGDTPVNTNDVTVSDDGNGNAVLTFPGGESLTLLGVSPASLSTPASLHAIGIPLGPDGIVSGTDGNDLIDATYTGDPDGDLIDNNDAVHDGAVTGDDDIVHAGGGDDTVVAGLGDDEVHGGTGGDTLSGEDTISGGTGDDTITGGNGADTLTGGDGADTFIGGSVGDTVDGGEGGTDNDTLDLTGQGPLRVHYDAANPENGYVEFRDADGNTTGTMTFENIETVIPYFTPDTMITTAEGQRPVQELRQGDWIIIPPIASV